MAPAKASVSRYLLLRRRTSVGILKSAINILKPLQQDRFLRNVKEHNQKKFRLQVCNQEEWNTSGQY